MTEVRVTILETGYCVHPEHVVLRNRRARTMRFPAMFALLEHPTRGAILFDTGYGQGYVDASRTLTGRIYNAVTPVTTSLERFAAPQLRSRGIDPGDVELIVASHFHADHVAGLADFPRARYVYFRSAWQDVARLKGLRALRKGFLPSLIPANFEARSLPIEEHAFQTLDPALRPFERGADLLGDGSLMAVPLPGHAAGQIGLFVRRKEGAPLLLAADACWTSRSFREEIMPSSVTRLLFDNTRQYRGTLGLLAELHRRRPDLEILPSHCTEAAARHHLLP